MIFGFTPIELISYIATILIAMSVHEAMHAYVGYKLGDTTALDEGRVSLNPFRHIDPFTSVILPIITLILFKVPILAARPVPFNPSRLKYDEFGAALVALAGPLSNLGLAIVGALLYKLIPAGTTLQDMASIFIILNVALFVFNLIPIPPLDGSRVLYAFAPRPVQEIMEQIEPIGMMVIFALVLLGGRGGLLNDLNSLVLRLLP